MRSALVLALVLAASVTTYVHGLPFDWTNSSPLSWDQAGHYFQATQIADGIRDSDSRPLLAATRGSDQYPPGHSVALGTWFLAFGQDMAGWLTFGLVVFVATTLLLLRAGIVGAIAFLISPMLAGLAPTLMVEPVACLWLVAALSLFPQPGEHPVPVWRFVAFGVAAAGTLLTKYNVGLPLLPAAILAALLSRDRRVIVGTVVAVAFVAGSWAGFLSWQDDGWSSFLRFAENRSNSAGQSPFDRLAWYASTFERESSSGGGGSRWCSAYSPWSAAVGRCFVADRGRGRFRTCASFSSWPTSLRP